MARGSFGDDTESSGGGGNNEVRLYLSEETGLVGEDGEPIHGYMKDWWIAKADPSKGNNGELLTIILDDVPLNDAVVEAVRSGDLKEMLRNLNVMNTGYTNWKTWGEDKFRSYTGIVTREHISLFWETMDAVRSEFDLGRKDKVQPKSLNFPGPNILLTTVTERGCKARAEQYEEAIVPYADKGIAAFSSRTTQQGNVGLDVLRMIIKAALKMGAKNLRGCVFRVTRDAATKSVGAWHDCEAVLSEDDLLEHLAEAAEAMKYDSASRFAAPYDYEGNVVSDELWGKYTDEVVYPRLSKAARGAKKSGGGGFKPSNKMSNNGGGRSKFNKGGGSRAGSLRGNAKSFGSTKPADHRVDDVAGFDDDDCPF